MPKLPQQARSKKTRQKLMDSLESLLREKEFDQITVAEIAQSAGVSTGLLYSHFKNKADFLEALLEEYKSRIKQRLNAVEAGDINQEFVQQGSLRNGLRLIARFAYFQLVDDAHIIRAIAYSLKSRPEADRLEWENLRLRAFETIAPILDVYSHELKRPNTNRTAEMLVYFFNTIYADAILFNDHSDSTVDKMDQEAFIYEVADFAYGYLRTEPVE